MGNKRYKFRFAVGDPNGPRGISWSIWTNRNDIYVASRGSNGLAKVSIHETGKCHCKVGAGVLQQTAPSGGSRVTPYMNKWDVGTIIAPGCQLKFRIHVPIADLRDYRTGDEAVVTWIAPDQAGPPVVIVGIVISDVGVTFASGDWPGRTNMRLNLLSGTELPDGRVLWVLYLQNHWPGVQEIRDMINAQIGKWPDRLKRMDDLRAVAVVDSTDGVGGLVELALSAG